MSTTVTSHLRPGVYSVYEASSVVGRFLPGGAGPGWWA